MQALFLVIGFVIGLALRGLRADERRMKTFPTFIFGITGSCLGVLLGAHLSDFQVAGISPAGAFGGVLGTMLAVQLGDVLGTNSGAARPSQERQTRTI